MKTRRYKITTKKPVSSKVNKKRYGYNTPRTWGIRSNVTLEKLDNLNEVIRKHKTQRAEGSSWKLVPKDSCEVYKERCKRKIENARRIDENMDEDETYKKRTGRRIVRRQQANRKYKKKDTKPYTKRTQRKRLQPSDSSIASCNCDGRYDCNCSRRCNCDSPSSTASSARSSVTVSDMEYD